MFQPTAPIEEIEACLPKSWREYYTTRIQYLRNAFGDNESINVTVQREMFAIIDDHYDVCGACDSAEFKGELIVVS